jgi:phosphatidylserine decarboxylase
LAQADSLFQLQTGRYESPDNWHSWNDFFTRRLSDPIVPVGNDTAFLSPCDGCITDRPVKTASLANWLDLLGDSPFRTCFEGGTTFHIVLDMYDYHRFHAPVGGTILDLRLIDGVHHAGGIIIWDATEHRYRYEQPGDTSFQMIEKRGVLVLETCHFGKITIIPVGVAQVSSVNWNSSLAVGSHVRQGDELGFFLCGGSDIVLLFEKNRSPLIASHSVKAGELIADKTITHPANK